MGSDELLDLDRERFPSLAALRLAHAELLKRHRDQANTVAMFGEIDEFLVRARETGVILDEEDARWTAQGLLDYWATTLLRAGRTVHDASLADFDPSLAPDIPDDQCPYLGLDAFQEDDAGRFFGRGRLVPELCALVAHEPLVVVLGASGSGKSSLVRSGLIPALRSGGVTGSEHWSYLPAFMPGSEPMLSLARALATAGLGAGATSDAPRLAQALESGVQRLDQLLSSADRPVVIVVDQFEEVFTLTEGKAARESFIAQLVSATEERRHRIVLTMRSDYETFLAQAPALQALAERATVRVTPMSAADLREAIERPAEQVGLRFEAGLVDALVADTLGEPAGLPLLQFSLLKLWDRRDHNRVTWDAYKALGGGRLALARSADAFYDRLIPEDQITARRLLLRMVRPGDGLEVTSSRVRRTALFERSDAPDRVERVLQRLIAERLVRMTSGDSADDDQVEVAHEALVRNWPRLVEWLEDERQEIAVRRRLETRAQEWERLGAASSGLLDEIQLREAEHWLRGPAAAVLGVAPSVPTFVAASRAALDAAKAEADAVRQRELEQAMKLAELERSRAHEQRLVAVRLRRLLVALVSLLVAAVTLSLVAMRQRQEAVEQRTTVERAVVAERNAREQAEEQRREALDARSRADEQRRLADEASRQAIAAQREADVARLKAVELEQNSSKALANLQRATADLDAVRNGIILERLRTGFASRRELHPGVSVGTRTSGGYGPTGTLCCIVRDASGQRFALGNAQIFTRAGDEATLPGYEDAGGEGPDPAGAVVRVGSDPERSGAIVRVAQGVALSSVLAEISAEMNPRARTRQLSRPGTATVGQRVWMLGRGSGLTQGTVMSIGTVRPVAGRTLGLDDIVISNQNLMGDVGAPVFSDEGEIIGLQWSPKGQSRVVPIRLVLQELGVELSD
jgi:hypothetical protein